MALTKKQTAYLVGGVAIIGSLYFAKRQILSVVAQAQSSNNAAIAQHQQNAAALTAARTLSGLGDVPPIAPPAALVATGVNLTEVATIVSTTVTALGGVVSLILAYLALEEKRQALYGHKASA